MNELQPGNVWCTVNDKGYSWSWATNNGFTGAMHSTAIGGSILNKQTLHAPYVLGVRKSEQAPYIGHHGGAAWADTFKKVLAKILYGAQVANSTGLTSGVANLAAHIANVPKVPAPLERGEVAVPGNRPAPLGQAEGPATKKIKWGGAYF
jgi:hypothetical protein